MNDFRGSSSLRKLRLEKCNLQKKYVPILSAIPIIGYFFKTTSVQKEQRELLMFITPTIID